MTEKPHIKKVTPHQISSLKARIAKRKEEEEGINEYWDDVPFGEDSMYDGMDDDPLWEEMDPNKSEDEFEAEDRKIKEDMDERMIDAYIKYGRSYE